MPKTEKTRVRRIPKRGHYELETIQAILKDSMICHLGFVYEGYPVVIPTICAPDGEYVYFHGAASSRMLRTLEEGTDACLTVSHVDALVVARSAFHHSMNYRSVVVFGQPELLEGEEKVKGMEIITNHILPGRWDEVRPMKDIEMKATKVFRLPLSEASAKIRAEGVGDDAEDYELDIWAGLVPMKRVYGKPKQDPNRQKDEPLPKSVQALFEENE